MGLFVAISGVPSATIQETADSLKRYVDSRGGLFEAEDNQPVKESERLILKESDSNHVSAFYPYDFFDWDEASQFLSKDLRKPVFSFHIHDGDMWIFQFFVNGELVDSFNPIPGYWDEEFEDAPCGGNASLIAAYWPNITPPQIENYFVTWDMDDDEALHEKAYPEDEFARSEWQLCDFMRKLGLEYPMDNSGNSLGRNFRMQVPSV